MADIKFTNIGSQKRERHRSEEKKSLSSLVYEIIKYLNKEKGQLVRDIGKGKVTETTLNNEIVDFVDRNKVSFISYTRDQLIEGIRTYLYSYYVYQELLDDKSIQEVRTINRSLTRIVRIDNKGKVIREFDYNEKFETDESYNDFIEFIATRNGRELNQSTAQIIVTDKYTCEDGILRITITNKKVDGKGNAQVLFAKTPRKKQNMDDLLNLKMFSPEMKEYFIDNLHCGISMMIVGVGGAGKTRLLNALIEEIEEDKDTMVIQRDGGELHSNKPNIYFEDISDEMVGGSLPDLTRAGMKQRIKVFIIGELEGEETFTFLNAGFSGHQVMSTLHVDGAENMTTKATQYAQYANVNLSEKTFERIFSTIPCVTYVDSGMCLETVELEWDTEHDCIKYTPIFKYDVNKNEFVRVGESNKVVREKKLLYRRIKGLLD